NKILGNFELVGIPPAPRGVPQIEVTFDIDANGILNVTAKDTGSGKEQAIKITAKSGLNEDEIDRMVKEAELHAEEDKKKKEAITQRNNLDSLVYQTEKLVSENKDKFSEDDLKPLNEAIAASKKVLENQEASSDDLKKSLDELTQASHAFSSKLYEQQKASGEASAEAGSTGGAEAKSGDDDVIDADYKDVD
ncbi:MAG TPA: molecular chaperone DnaK, partial [Bdellovibrionales bacterium]|nr:molecular chaperone DnaK [Bdellovibrionales bacterium]